MSVPAQRALRSAIDNREFEPVYYLYGDDEYRKDEAVTQLVAAALDPATRDFNFDAHRGPETDAERLSVSVNSLPMLAARRIVILRDVDGLKKAARAELDRYLKHPARETVLIIVSVAGEKPDADIASHSTSVAFPPLSSDKVGAWIAQQARRIGMELPDECAALIADAVGSDLAHAVGELDKLGSFASGRAVTVRDVEAIVGVRHGETLADLLNAVAARDGARAAALVEPVLAQPKTTGVQVVMALSVQTVAMAWGRAARDDGVPAQRLEGEFFTLLKTTGGFPMRPWGEAAKCWASNLSRWTASDLSRALEQLCAADVALKDTRISSEDAVVTSLVLTMCADASTRRVA